MKILFVIDGLEFKYFELNKLVTSFWLIATFLKRGYVVDVTTKEKLFLEKEKPFALSYNSFLHDENLLKTKEFNKENLNNYDVIFYRPDPPVDNDYINGTYVLDYATKPIILNSPSGLRSANEKLYINNFPTIIPDNIVSSNEELIIDFLNKNEEIVIKPLNKCFSKGVFYLHKNDKNTHTLIDMVTNSGTTSVMVQKYIKEIVNGDKRLVYIDGEIFPECVRKIHGKDDFKFNTHSAEFFEKGEMTEKEKTFAKILQPKLEKDGIYIAGLDVVGDKIIEINLTSPCFFIKEVNHFFNISFEEKIVDSLKRLINRLS